MQRTIRTLSALTAVACFPALAAPHAHAQGSTPAVVDVYYETEAVGFEVHARVEGAAGSLFALVLHAPDQHPLTALRTGGLLGFGSLDANGHGRVSSMVAESTLDPVAGPLAFSAVYREGAGVGSTGPADLLLGVGGTPCETLDFNHRPEDSSTMVAGRRIAEQWEDAGVHVSAVNATAGHPDEAILFDTANPTGDDDDLATPNLGSVGNDTALGHVLIIAENDDDVGPVDDLVDTPDDEQFGGSLIFDFDEGATVCSVTLLDIDEAPGSELRFYRNGNLATPDETMPILTLGDNSVQVMSFFEADVDRFEVFLAGSGAVGPLELIPCPRTINFDENTFGVPLDLQTGEWMTDQFGDLGLTISAVNLGGGPNKAILFDSENPTGGDFDLQTPNPGVVGNDRPLGKVLIIAENDVDVNPADGLVDDPDDQEGGGVIRFEFTEDVEFRSARVLDVDGSEVDFFRFYDAGGVLIQSILIPDAPDGNVQLIQGMIPGVRAIELELGGSGAVTRLRYCPDAGTGAGGGA